MRPIIATRILFIIATYFSIEASAQNASAQDNAESLNINYEVKEIIITDDSIKIRGNQYVPALSVGIPESNAAEVSKRWGKKIRNKTKSKITQQNGVSFLYQTTLKKVSPAPLNVYYSCFQDNKDTRLIASFEIDSVFISPVAMSSKYTMAYNFIQNFSRKQYSAAVRDVLKGEKKKLRHVEREMNKLFRKKERFETMVKDREMGISNLENQLKENELAAKRKTDELIAKKEFMVELTGEAREEQEKILKGLERDQRKIERQGRSMGKKIAHYKADIRKSEHGLERNASERELQKKRVQEQLSVVKSLEEKLREIN